MRSQKEYWNSVADTKEFTTPMQSAVFCRYVNRDAAILDVGCGYGRVLNELHGLGFSHLRGIDFSEQLIRRGKRQFPFLDLQVQEAETIDAPEEPVYVRDSEGRYATYADERILVSEARPGYRATVSLVDENGETVRVVSEDTYDAMAQIVYVGVQQRN